ncbi:MAG TPA: chorismate-binding protein, partial [Pseudomonadales bacterium]
MPSPVIETLSIDCPALKLLPALAARRFPLALLSGHHSGDWDILMADPVRTLCQQGNTLSVMEAEQTQTLPADSHAFAVLDDWQQAHSRAPQSLPFTGGLAGFCGYESLHNTLQITAPAHGPAVPDLWMGDYRWALLHHRRDHQWYLVADTAERATAIQQWLTHAVSQTGAAPFQLRSTFTGSTDQTHYRQAFARVQAYLQAGDCYQVNLARHFAAPYSGSPVSAFMALAQAHSAPYSAYMGLPDNKAVLSFSPESFLHMDANGHIH